MIERLQRLSGFEQIKRYAPYLSWSLLVVALTFCLGSLQTFARSLDRVSESIQIDAAPQASLVYDRYGHVIFSFGTEDRTDTSLDHVSESMIAAVLVAEDRQFFKHSGVDLRGVARAAMVDLREWDAKQGGSTITQQLVRLVALTRNRTFGRKVKEAFLAVRVERRFEKGKILEAYLNRIYLGDGHYGVEAAARGYFGKRAADLTGAEGALLAGVIKCPSVCSPRMNPSLARSRRDIVLASMHEAGRLNDRDYAAALATPINLIPERHDLYGVTELTAVHERSEEDDACGMYFLEAVRQEVMARYGALDVLRGGLRIYTTVDMNLQKQAEEAITARLQQIGPRKKGGQAVGPQDTLQGALVAIDPQTGEVLAVVGGRDFHQSPFNRAIQARRQPGSAFKPLVFAAAIEAGYSPSSLITNLDTPIGTPQGAWLPFGEHEAESYTLRRALTVSSNRAAVRLMQLVGISSTQSYARRLGIASPLPSVPSLAIGTAEVSLLDLTSAYGVFANGGIMAPHTLISKIEDRNGDLIWQSSQGRQPYRAIRAGTAFLMSSMLADAIDRGTGSRARSEGFKLPAAGKTGTTDDYGDAWFIGYTPHIVAGVWFGYDDHTQIMNRGFAGTVAVPAWARFMMKATAGQPPDRFKPSGDVERMTVCRATGLRATDSCKLVETEDGKPNVYDDYFLAGTGPYDTCPGHTAPPPPAF